MKKEAKKTFSIEKALLGSQRNYLEALQRDKAEIQLAVLTAKTPSKLIKLRKGKGGKTFRYVTGGAFTRALNLAFGLNWNFEIKESQREGNQLVVLGRLTVKLNGEEVVKEQYGSAEVYEGVPLGDLYKKAATDSMKKCASNFLFGDIYGQIEDEIEEQEKPVYSRAAMEAAIEKLESGIVSGELDVKEATKRIENGLVIVRQSGYNDLIDRLVTLKGQLK